MSALLSKLKNYLGSGKELSHTQTGIEMTEAKIRMLERLREIAKTEDPPDMKTIEYVNRRLQPYRAAELEREYYERHKANG